MIFVSQLFVLCNIYCDTLSILAQALLFVKYVTFCDLPKLKSAGLASPITGGEGGIRTPDTLPHTRFRVVRLQPLGHLSIGCYYSRFALLRGRSNKKASELTLIISIGTPDRIRTYGLRLRKPTLYPAELRVHTAV